MRAVLNNPPHGREIVIVIGAGTIGLMNVAALKAVEPSCRVVVVAKYPFQAELARNLGAEFVIDSQAEDVMAQVKAGAMDIEDERHEIAQDWTPFLDAAKQYCATNHCL